MNTTSTSVPDNFVNLETAGLRCSPRNHKKGILPPHCFWTKIINVTSGLSRKSLSSVNPNAIDKYADVLNSFYDGTVSILYAFVTNQMETMALIHTYLCLNKKIWTNLSM